ncbi:MAG: NADPH-dependent glutamate synthase [Clostridiales bacterium]|jgi:glutamate synthase (NADPH/NADH) small chain|nr:NADPH-dependent glutamate synthase [Clostridiales bacterium]
MPNMSLHKLPAREQAPDIRNTNFEEVSQGYDENMAVEEAARCLQCKNRPCVAGCPVNVDIPAFIAHIAKGEFMESYGAIRQTNSLPAICGRVCPQETQCEQLCVRGIKGEPVGIGRLERFAADYAMGHKKEDGAQKTQKRAPNGKRVAVVGSGPAGLTCAGDLAKLGYEVTIFEALHTPGGVLVYGIPEFRLPKALVREEIATVENLGVAIETNTVVGRAMSLDELMNDEGYAALFIGTGAGLPNFQKIPGENLNGVYSANEFLTRINLMKAYAFPEADTPVRVGKSVAVIGGGNVAMDAARSARRLGARHVYIVYRRSEKEMPARAEEVHHAREEGIIFRLLCNPTAIEGDENGEVARIRCVEMELGDPDASGRRRPVVKQGSDFTLEVQTVVVAIGNSPNPLIKNTTPGLKTQSWGGIIADEETGETSKPFVYAGGDAVSGAATVILAMGAGKKAAAAIHEKLSAK